MRKPGAAWHGLPQDEPGPQDQHARRVKIRLTDIIDSRALQITDHAGRSPSSRSRLA